MVSTMVEVNAADAIVRGAASGDEVAFARLIDEYHEPMVRAAYVIVGDVLLAHEAAQDSWVIAWQRLASLRDPEKIRPWLVAICANEARRLARRSRRRRVIEITLEPPGPEPVDPVSVIDVLDLERALTRLKPDERGLLAMRYVVGLDSHDIARAVGLSASGVRSRLSRLVERLRRDLDDA
jgi:RNA polymerase sigma-70 factor (ECF subfamily)